MSARVRQVSDQNLMSTPSAHFVDMSIQCWHFTCESARPHHIRNQLSPHRRSRLPNRCMRRLNR